MNLERKVGGTDLYERQFRPPLQYDDFAQARTATFRIVVQGTDIWEIDHYTMTGKFKKLGMTLHAQEGRSTTDVSWGWRDLGWRLMACRDENIVADPRVSTGGFIFTVVLNGTF